MRITLSLAAAAVLAWAGTASAQTTITSYDPVTHSYRVTTTRGSGTYVITSSGMVSDTNGGIITTPRSDANAPHYSYNPGGTTPFYAGATRPFGYTGSSVSRTPGGL